MNLTLRDISDLMNDLAEPMGGNFRGSPEPRDIMRHLDWAMKTLAAECDPYKTNIVFSPVPNQSVYRLDDLRYFDRIVMRPDQIVYAGTRITSYEGRGYGPWTHRQAIEFHQNYNTDPSLSRDIVVYGGSNRIEVYPSPTSSKIASGASYIDGTIVPGWLLSDGGYWPGGPPFGSDYLIQSGTPSSSSSSTKSPGSAAAYCDATTHWGNPSNSLADDGSVATFGSISSYSGYDYLGVKGFAFAVPTTATSVTIRIQSLKFAALTGIDVTLEFVADVTDPNSPPLATQSVATSDSGVIETVGPLALITSIPGATINGANFGVRISSVGSTTGEIITTPPDIKIDHISLKATWTAPSSSPSVGEGGGGPGGTSRDTTDWDAIPDLPSQIHEALAVLAAYKAANPVAMTREAMAAMQRIVPDAMAALKVFANENRRAIVTPSPVYNRFRSRV